MVAAHLLTFDPTEDEARKLRTPIRSILSDEQLADINQAHSWQHTLLDVDGRPVGNGNDQLAGGWNDIRVVQFLDRFPQAGRVLEPACGEGVMTSALCYADARVTAFDGRAACVAKTHARTGAFGFFPTVRQFDAREIAALGPFDAIFHSGLLYHLANPFEHLKSLCEMTSLVALHSQCNDGGSAVHEGYEGEWREEVGPRQELEGLDKFAFRPTRRELCRMIADSGWQAELLWEEHYGGPHWIVFYFLTKP